MKKLLLVIFASVWLMDSSFAYQVKKDVEKIKEYTKNNQAKNKKDKKSEIKSVRPVNESIAGEPLIY